MADSSRELLKFDDGPSSGLQIVHWTPSKAPENRAIKTQTKLSSIDASYHKSEHSKRTQSAMGGGVALLSRSPNRQVLRPPRIIQSELTKRALPYFQNPNLWFPLYQDHLVPLIYYNVFRATLTNIHILSLTSLLTSSCTSKPHEPVLFPSPSTIPPTLLPTKLQRVTPHESWIDLLPSGTMRDNAIKFRADYDQHDLCKDLIGS
ncbi:hypothetical protein CGRA01v4_00010 [Colletotrichum graminicola]|nr:hypothetical protein CGRA01v4_00010 [Colletotrichum graminicola]